MMKKRLKDKTAIKKEILLEAEVLLLESRNKLVRIKAKLHEIADLEVKLKIKTMGMSRLIKSYF